MYNGRVLIQMTKIFYFRFLKSTKKGVNTSTGPWEPIPFIIVYEWYVLLKLVRTFVFF